MKNWNMKHVLDPVQYHLFISIFSYITNKKMYEIYLISFNEKKTKPQRIDIKYETIHSSILVAMYGN